MTGNDAEFARWMGVNKSTVCRARKAGRLVLAKGGKVDFEKSAKRWHETAGGRTDVAARHAAQRGATLPTPQSTKKSGDTAQGGAASAGLDATDTVQPADNGSRTNAKTLLMHYENAAIKFEMALRRGLRLERAAIRHEAAGLGAMLRAGIERVIDQTAPRLAAASNELDRRRIIANELHRLRWIFKREMPRALRRIKESSAGVSKGAEA